jgi:uracil-DNA glycosylase family 4
VIEAERQGALDAIGSEVAACTRCRLHETRTRSVPGEGSAATEVVFVGEGPGFNEDRLGRPFVGQAGALLTELLGSVGWTREEVFIANVVKCRPPGNRDPEPEEIAACAPFLSRQLEALDPALVVTLGRFSMARFNPGARIGQVHGTFQPADPASGAPRALTYAMYHPAAALHQGSLKATLFRDMEGVPVALLQARERRVAGTGSPGQDAVQIEAATPLIEAPAEDVSTNSVEAEPTRPAALEAGAIGESAVAAQSIELTSQTDPTDQLTLF